MAGRPREFDRDEALRKARDLFWTRGYEGVSMADLVDVLGIASARIYAAFGSKAALFREAIDLYEREEGGFAARALAEEKTALDAVERTLVKAIELYTRAGRPKGCMVVTAAVNCAEENGPVADELMERRRTRTEAFLDRMVKGVADGDLASDCDVAALADFVAALLHGVSVQARDGVSRDRLLKIVPAAVGVMQRAGSDES
ncbi:MAG TPA: TetR/AcrR family transcriptional regulator [Hansschlegelia sp.]